MRDQRNSTCGICNVKQLLTGLANLTHLEFLTNILVSGVIVPTAIMLAPVVLLTGVLLARSVPGRGRAPIQAALLIAGTLLLFTYPELRGYGHALANPTSLPHNYAANLAVVVAAVVIVTIAAAVVGVSANRRSGGG